MFTSSDAEWTHVLTKAIERTATRALCCLPSLSGGDVLITERACAGVKGPLQLLGLFVQP